MGRVQGTRRSFGVVLHAKGRDVVTTQTLKGAIVQTHVGLGHSRHRSGLNCKIVALACDFDPPAINVSDRDVASVVPELHFVGFTTEGKRKNLVT